MCGPLPPNDHDPLPVRVEMQQQLPPKRPFIATTPKKKAGEAATPKKSVRKAATAPDDDKTGNANIKHVQAEMEAMGGADFHEQPCPCVKCVKLNAEFTPSSDTTAKYKKWFIYLVIFLWGASFTEDGRNTINSVSESFGQGQIIEPFPSVEDG
jgi:hypothetical protein